MRNILEKSTQYLITIFSRRTNTFYLQIVRYINQTIRVS